ncbi:MAG TPA: proteasome activator [Acidimicrobiia bacterium]
MTNLDGQNQSRGSGGPVLPEVVDGETGRAPDGAGNGDESSEQVTRPTKLIRIASMVRNMLDEVRRAPLDDAGRRMLGEIHNRSMSELEEVLSPDLQAELQEVTLPFTSDTPSESELRIAQAQLVGWLEGLFHGIQATLFTQQIAAQSQLDQMRQRQMLEAGGPGGPGAPGRPPGPPGQYL